MIDWRRYLEMVRGRFVGTVDADTQDFHNFQRLISVLATELGQSRVNLDAPWRFEVVTCGVRISVKVERDKPTVERLREMALGLGLDPSEVILTDEEIAARKEQ